MIFEAIASVPREIWGWVLAHPLLASAIAVAVIALVGFLSLHRREVEQ